MIDGKYKSKIDLFWNFLAKSLVRTGLTPNQITWIGLGLMAINCVAYINHQNSLVFGIALAIIFALDSLDGAVARITNNCSLYGGYLDAVIDRYQEIIVFFTIAYVHDYWEITFIAITASLLISYNKARTAVEIKIDNDKWPDLLERLERVIIICTVLIFNQIILLPESWSIDLLFIGLLIIAILGHFTAIQRFFRARKNLLESSK